MINMAYKYFISYRRKTGGESQAPKVAEILSKYVGKDKIFYDRVSMREGNWREQINAALNSAEHFVLLVNEASAAEDQSNNVGGYRYEIEYALNSEKMKNNHITIIAYDNDSYKALTKDFSDLNNAQKVTFNGEYNFAFEERLCKHFGFDYKAENSATTIKKNISIPQNLVPRTQMLVKIQNAYENINGYNNEPYNCVVISGIGGSGKTSLAYLYAQKFDNKVMIKIPNELNENIITYEIAKRFPEINDNLKKDLNDLISKLDQINTNNNLLIIDIKRNSIDIKYQIESIIPRIRLNKSWKILVLTRTYPSSPDFKTIPMEYLTEEEAIEIFKNHFKDKDFAKIEQHINNIVEKLCYHPMLIVTASTFYNASHYLFGSAIRDDLNNITNNKLIKDEAAFNRIKGDNTEKSLYEYLINIFTIDDTEKKYLAYYLTLPDKPLYYDTIKTLLKPEISEEILPSLEGKGILYRDMEKDQYTMHSLVRILLHEHIIDYFDFFDNIKNIIITNKILDKENGENEENEENEEKALSIVNSLFYKELGSITKRIEILDLIIGKNDKYILNSHCVEINKMYDTIILLINKLKKFRIKKIHQVIT